MPLTTRPVTDTHIVFFPPIHEAALARNLIVKQTEDWAFHGYACASSSVQRLHWHCGTFSCSGLLGRFANLVVLEISTARSLRLLLTLARGRMFVPKLALLILRLEDKMPDELINDFTSKVSVRNLDLHVTCLQDAERVSLCLAQHFDILHLAVYHRLINLESV